LSHAPIAVPPSDLKKLIASFAWRRVCGVICTRPAPVCTIGYARYALWLPAMIAKYVPSRIASTATMAACLAARMLVSPIDPDVSTMMISPAAPDPVCPAAPAPTQSIVTIALTSVPPSGRNSFW
jgi:hypothetical protein